MVDERRLLDETVPEHTTARYERTVDVDVIAARKSSSRFHALDAFRGIVVCLMILVDDAAQAYNDALSHSPVRI